MAVLCMLYKIRCNPKHPLCGTLPVPYVSVRVTRGADRISVYFCASPLQNIAVPQDFYSPQCLSGIIWLTPYLMVGIGGFQEQVQCLFVGLVALSFFVFNYFPFLFFSSIGLWGWGLRTDRVSISFSRPCIANLF